MSIETQQKLGLTDEQVDFDEFLQDDQPKARQDFLKKKLNLHEASIEGLRKAHIS